MVENKKDSSHLSISMINLKRSAVLGILVILLLVAIGAASYFYLQFAELKKNPQKIAQQEVQELVSKVSKLIVLPEGEIPTVATVTDPEKLKDQPFFAKTKKGDKILIYTNAKKAILYDPVANKIVEVAPLNIGGTTTPSPSPTPSP
jgi:septation ring formation regulator EzrA